MLLLRWLMPALLVASALLVVPTAPPAAAVAVPAPEDWYTYDARFSYHASYRHFRDHRNGNSTDTAASFDVDGVVLGIRLSPERMLPGRAGDAVVDGTASFDETVDDGNHVASCSSSKVSDPTGLQPRVGGRAGARQPGTLWGHFALHSTMQCSSSSEPSYEQDFDLGPLTAPFVVPAAAVGSPTIRVELERDLPRSQCPGADESGTTLCHYFLGGSMTLTRKAGPSPYHRPAKASLDKRGGAGVTAACRVACTARLTVTPLRGSKVLARKSARLQPRSTKRLTTRLSAGERRQVARAGGARLTTTYTSAGERGASYSVVVRPPRR